MRELLVRMARSHHREAVTARAHILLAPAALATALVATAALSVIAGNHVATQQVARQARTTSAVTAKGTPAATTTGWRVVAAFPQVDGDTVSGTIAANSASAAWSVWTSPPFAAVYRWTGKVWSKVPLTIKVAPYVRSAVAFDGDSASDFWLFSSYRTTEALHWTGKAWKISAIPSWALQKDAHGDTAAVLGPDNVWVFSLEAGRYAAHYNGHAWAKAKLPAAIDEVSTVAADDIWALAGKLALHWNGHSWTTIKIPAAAGNTPEGFGNLSATGPKNAWVWRTRLVPGIRTMAQILHWNGATWQQVAASPADIIFSSAPDGAGGLWATGVDINPGGFDDFYHLTGSHWTQADNPASVFNHEPEYLTWIPGTRSLWGVATGVTPKGILDSVILKYGP